MKEMVWLNQDPSPRPSLPPPWGIEGPSGPLGEPVDREAPPGQHDTQVYQSGACARAPRL